MRFASLLMCVVLLPAIARAQVSGVITDDVAQRRVPGAVITVYDSSHRVIRQALADDSGRFRIEGAGAARRIRVVKIGYRPVELAVASGPMRVALQRLPNMLEPIRTSDQPTCPRSATRPAAFGLWEQARAALLGSVVARETNNAFVRRINFRRYMKPNGEDIERQSVRWEASMALRSFDASYPASEFMSRGFADQEGQHLRFYGPDAEVLLDDAFINGYCLELAEPKRERAGQVGLRFRPMKRAQGRVDLDGVVWIDTAARVLNDIEYLYLGLERWADRYRPGGTIAFRETSPATLWIDRWWIRMMGAGKDGPDRPAVPAWSRRTQVIEAGAELASARWPSGHEWKASLGAADIELTRAGGREGERVGGARVQLDSTDYVGVTDQAGRVRIDELLPGPYSISVFDSTLAVIDTTLPASVGFVAKRDSVSRVKATVPTLLGFVRKECVAHDSAEPRESYIFIARIIGKNGMPMIAARWRLEPTLVEDPNARNGEYAHGMTGNDGLVYVCERLSAGRRVLLRVWAPTEEVKADNGVELRAVLVDRITTAKLTLHR